MDNNSLNYKRKSYIEIGELIFWTATINKWQRLLEDDMALAMVRVCTNQQ